MLTRTEKDVLVSMLTKELEQFRKDKKGLIMESAMPFLKAESNYELFLEKLIDKLNHGK